MTGQSAESNSGFWSLAGRWSTRCLRVVLAMVLVASAALLSYAVLLNVIIRDVPEPTTVAEDLVADLAIDAGVAPADAQAIAEEVVAYVDETMLDSSLDTADDIRLGIKILPVIPLVLIPIGLLMIPGGWSRRRWLGMIGTTFGGILLLSAWVLRRGALEASEAATQSVEDTAEQFIGHLLAPAWPIGWIALGLGMVLWAIGLGKWFRGNAEPAE